jgi:hypothetical protein
LIWSVILVAVMMAMGTPVAMAGDPTPQLVAIPLTALDISEAVATVSVLEDPDSSVASLMGICDSEFVKKLHVEGEDIQGAIQKLCGMMKGLAKEITPPPKGVTSNTYVLSVPLKRPQGHIRAITWKAESLDDALTFVELLKDGHLKAVKVFSSIPRSSNPTQPCAECPVKDLVFRVDAIKDKRHLLK